MNKLLSCHYNMDTNRVEARFEDGTTLAIDCIAVEDEYGNTPRASGLYPADFSERICRVFLFVIKEVLLFIVKLDTI